MRSSTKCFKPNKWTKQSSRTEENWLSQKKQQHINEAWRADLINSKKEWVNSKTDYLKLPNQKNTNKTKAKLSFKSLQNLQNFINSQCTSLFSCPIVSNSLQRHGLQHARLPCPSLPPGVCSNMSVELTMPSKPYRNYRIS